MITHTATPWRWHEQGEANEFCILTENGKGWVIAFRQNGEMMPAQQHANMQFIVTACNAHDDLVAALQRIANSEPMNTKSLVCDFDALQGVARAALAKLRSLANIQPIAIVFTEGKQATKPESVLA